MVAAAALCAGPLEVVSDSKFVVNGCQRIRNGESVSSWHHADLWQRLVPDIVSGRLCSRWTPAHLTASQARSQGIAERDRLGNAAADSAAGMAASLRMPAPAMVRQRLQALSELEAVQRVLASVQSAVVDKHTRSCPGPPQPREWRRVRRGARAAAPLVRQAPVAAERASRPAGEQLAAFFAGRTWRPHLSAQGPGRVWCIRCGATARDKTSLEVSSCRGQSESLSPLLRGLVLFAGLYRIGGDAGEFDDLVQQRCRQLPRAPD